MCASVGITTNIKHWYYISIVCRCKTAEIVSSTYQQTWMCSVIHLNNVHIVSLWQLYWKLHYRFSSLLKHVLTHCHRTERKQMSTVSPVTLQMREYLVIENLFAIPKIRNYIFLYLINRRISPTWSYFHWKQCISTGSTFDVCRLWENMKIDELTFKLQFVFDQYK